VLRVGQVDERDRLVDSPLEIAHASKLPHHPHELSTLHEAVHGFVF
jgi:hypothetical protein